MEIKTGMALMECGRTGRVGEQARNIDDRVVVDPAEVRRTVVSSQDYECAREETHPLKVLEPAKVEPFATVAVSIVRFEAARPTSCRECGCWSA